MSDDLIPLSVLQLDMPEPTEGWTAHLGKQGVAIVRDDLGRSCVSRQHARMLLDQKRADELRRQRFAAQQEREAIEADERRRAQIWGGLSADTIPIGVNPVAVMLQAAKDTKPRRRSPLEESLSGSTLTYHELPRDAS